jgi:hypothetical protein
MMLAHSFRAFHKEFTRSQAAAHAKSCAEGHCRQALTDAMEIGAQRAGLQKIVQGILD